LPLGDLAGAGIGKMGIRQLWRRWYTFAWRVGIF
jgi:hypothetical protein